MYDVPIPDDIYERAKQAAKANRVSVAEYVAEAVLSRLDEFREVSESDFFTPEVMEEIREAAVAARQGENLTPQELDAHFDARRKEWLENHPA